MTSHDGDEDIFRRVDSSVAANPIASLRVFNIHGDVPEKSPPTSPVVEPLPRRADVREGHIGRVERILKSTGLTLSRVRRSAIGYESWRTKSPGQRAAARSVRSSVARDRGTR